MIVVLKNEKTDAGREPVLVLGGSGFIGIHVVDKLLEKHYTPIVVDIVHPMKPLRDKAIFIQGDALDIDFLASIFRMYQPRKVIHLVGLPHIPTCHNNPHDSYLINTVSVHTVLECMRKYGAERIVFASTGAVYGKPSDRPLTEEDPVAPTTIYGMHKLEAELEIKAYSQCYRIIGVILRLFNVYGGNPNIGKDVISIFARNIAQGLPITVKGPNKYRDFVYIEDVAEAFVRSIETPKEITYSIINVGTGKKTKIIQIAKMLQELLNREVKVNIIEDPEDGTGYFADITKMKEILGITPRSIDIGLKEYIESNKKELNIK